MEDFSGKKIIKTLFRASVAGDSNRKLDSEELERMKAILEKGLKHGAY